MVDKLLEGLSIVEELSNNDSHISYKLQDSKNQHFVLRIQQIPSTVNKEIIQQECKIY